MANLFIHLMQLRTETQTTQWAVAPMETFCVPKCDEDMAVCVELHCAIQVDNDDDIQIWSKWVQQDFHIFKDKQKAVDR